jgi:hypothetical protein
MQTPYLTFFDRSQLKTCHVITLAFISSDVQYACVWLLARAAAIVPWHK